MSFLDKAKDVAGKAKDKVDGLVEENADKIPDNVGRAYGKASDAAEKYVRGGDAEPEHEKIIKDDV